MEPDDPGLQPQTGAQPGKLREIDDRSGCESPATGLNRAATPIFSSAQPIILPGGYPNRSRLCKAKTGGPYFRSAGKSFPAHSSRLFTRPRAVLGACFIITKSYE